MGSNIVFTLVAVFTVYLAALLFRRLLKRIGKIKRVSAKRMFYIGKVFEIGFVLSGLIWLTIIWSVDFKGISILASSIFAVIGVALFAQWSILSNVTSSIIIFFTFPARVGDTIRIIDIEECSVEGTIVEISLFQVELIDKEGNSVLYPNSLLMQKPVKKILSTAKRAGETSATCDVPTGGQQS